MVSPDVSYYKLYKDDFTNKSLTMATTNKIDNRNIYHCNNETDSHAKNKFYLNRILSKRTSLILDHKNLKISNDTITNSFVSHNERDNIEDMYNKHDYKFMNSLEPVSEICNSSAAQFFPQFKEQTVQNMITDNANVFSQEFCNDLDDLIGDKVTIDLDCNRLHITDDLNQCISEIVSDDLNDDTQNFITDDLDERVEDIIDDPHSSTDDKIVNDLDYVIEHKVKCDYRDKEFSDAICDENILNPITDDLNDVIDLEVAISLDQSIDCDESNVIDQSISHILDNQTDENIIDDIDDSTKTIYQNWKVCFPDNKGELESFQAICSCTHILPVDEQCYTQSTHDSSLSDMSTCNNNIVHIEDEYGEVEDDLDELIAEFQTEFRMLNVFLHQDNRSDTNDAQSDIESCTTSNDSGCVSDADITVPVRDHDATYHYFTNQPDTSVVAEQERRLSPVNTDYLDEHHQTIPHACLPPISDDSHDALMSVVASAAIPPHTSSATQPRADPARSASLQLRSDLTPAVSLSDVVTRIDSLLEQLDRSRSRQCAAEFVMPCRFKWRHVQLSDGRLDVNCKQEKSYRICEQSSPNRFKLVVTILNSIRRLIISNKYQTKRDLFYQNASLFRHQRVLDCLLDDVVRLLNMPRHMSHVRASSKGLVAGGLVFRDGKSIIDCSHTAQGVLVSATPEYMQIVRVSAKCIVVVEKDAVFQEILLSDFLSKFPVILITGKGYPDMNTRAFVKCLATLTTLPVYVLVDADPHGIEIMLIYKFGSLNYVKESEHLSTSKLEWLGLKPQELLDMNIPKSNMLALTDRDMAKARRLLERPYMKGNITFQREIRELINSRTKYELECLSSIHSTYLTDIYLPSKLFNMNTF